MHLFFSTAINVRERHELLLSSIGTFPEEDAAYAFVTMLLWLLPTVVAIHALVDATLVVIYLKFAHPWVGILKTE